MSSGRLEYVAGGNISKYMHTPPLLIIHGTRVVHGRSDSPTLPANRMRQRCTAAQHSLADRLLGRSGRRQLRGRPHRACDSPRGYVVSAHCCAQIPFRLSATCLTGLVAPRVRLLSNNHILTVVPLLRLAL